MIFKLLAMKTLNGILRFAEGLFLFGLAIYFAVFYIKGHFGKHWYLFWGLTIFLVCYKYQHDHSNEDNDKRPGYVIWEEKMRNYDAVRGY